MNTIILYVYLLFPYISARPWSANSLENGVDILSRTQSPFMSTIDSVTTSLSKALKTASPSLTPLLSFASLAYVGYIGSIMFFPSALTEFGLPLLEDFRIDQKSARTAETGFIDSLATGYMKDMLIRTEAADIVRNISMTAINNGMSTLKRTTKFVDIGLSSFQGVANKVTTMLTPECLSKYMCQVGQFTSIHLPALGPILRSINSVDLDDYSQALIDGTTIGDCSAVYFACPM